MEVSGWRLVLNASLVVGLTGAILGQTAPSDAVADLAGTSWQLVKFQGGDGKTLTPEDKSKYTIAFEKDRVSVRLDCNRGHGTRKSAGPNQLEFGPMALTQAMCPPAELTDRLPRDWGFVRSYVLRDGHLFLSLMADAGTYEFEPVRAAAPSEIKGTATYRERMALPEGAVFEATLEEVSRADAKAEVVGRARVEHPGSPPIAFAIPYDPAKIQKGHRYAVRGQILVDGKLFFTTERNYPVLGEGQKNEVELWLHRAGEGGKGPTTASLENTDWKLTDLGGTPVSAEHGPHFALSPKTHHVNGSGGCNRLMGSYEVKGAQLTFSQMATTRMACAQGMDTEEAFVEALAKVKRWKITGQQLELLDGDGQVVASFVRRAVK